MSRDGIVEYSIPPNGTNSIGQLSFRPDRQPGPLPLGVIHLSSGTAIGTSEADAASQILDGISAKWTIRRKLGAIARSVVREIYVVII